VSRPGKTCAIARTWHVKHRSNLPEKANSEGFLSMRDCRKGPGGFGRGGSVYDGAIILGKLRFQNNGAGSRDPPGIFPGSRRKIPHDTESGIFAMNQVLETISRLSGS
jgi:hypothetical protein